MKEIHFLWDVMEKGVSKGQINTFKKKIKYIARNILYYSSSKKIANFIMQHKYLSKTVYHYPVLCSKIHRPYMTNQLTIENKVQIIFDSYTYLDTHFKESFLEKFYTLGKEKILEIEGKTGKRVSVYFCLYTNYEKEGEFSLRLYQKEILLATLTFSVWNNIFFIGGLQGLGRQHNDPKLLKEVTKEFYGLFPKKMLLEIFYELFSEDKIAVGNENHIYLAKRYRHQEKRKIHANYNEFWESLGAKKREDGLWVLPKTILRKSLEEIPSKKRSEHRKRYEILDELTKLTLQFLKNTQ